MDRRSAIKWGLLSLASGPYILRHTQADAAPDTIGAWDARVRQPHIPIHVAAIPRTTRVLCIYGRGSAKSQPLLGGLAWQYDWATAQVVGTQPWNSVPFEYDPMCGGGILDDDGALRFYGGRTSGANRSARFDPETQQWSLGPWLSYKKSAYYSSALPTGRLPGYPHGAVINAFGRRTWTDIYDSEIYNADYVIPALPASANLALPNSELANYPRLRLLPDGTIFMAGTGQQLRRLDLTTATWTNAGHMLWGQRYEGCATPIGDSGYEFLLSGGDIAVVKSTMEIVDARTGVSRPTASVTTPRWQHNTVLLPDGMVLLMGGRATPTPYAPELYDPVTETVHTMASVLPLAAGTDDQGPAQRAYHSVADLLDDGRVLYGGGVEGTKGQAFEIFSPPYLFKGPRPALAVTNPHGTYGGTLSCPSTDAASITQVVLMTPGVVSHGCNFMQKRVVCAFTRSAGNLTVTLPANSNAVVPGWHRLIALRNGIPSRGQWIHLGLD